MIAEKIDTETLTEYFGRVLNGFESFTVVSEASLFSSKFTFNVSVNELYVMGHGMFTFI